MLSHWPGQLPGTPWDPAFTARKGKGENFMNAAEVFIGIDVSKDTLDVAVRPTVEEMTFANTEDGVALMTDFIQPFSARLIVLEATGGWEMTAASALAAKGLPVVIVNPRHVRDFAKSTGLLAKTDKLDARI